MATLPNTYFTNLQWVISSIMPTVVMTIYQPRTVAAAMVVVDYQWAMIDTIYIIICSFNVGTHFFGVAGVPTLVLIYIISM